MWLQHRRFRVPGGRAPRTESVAGIPTSPFVCPVPGDDNDAGPLRRDPELELLEYPNRAPRQLTGRPLWWLPELSETVERRHRSLRERPVAGRTRARTPFREGSDRRKGIGMLSDS